LQVTLWAEPSKRSPAGRLADLLFIWGRRAPYGLTGEQIIEVQHGPPLACRPTDVERPAKNGSLLRP
jgi:hypothetical protein